MPCQLKFWDKLHNRFETLILTLVSKKMVTGTAWSVVATLLLIDGRIGEQTWSTMILAMIGIIFSISTVEKIKGVKYEYPEPPEGH